MKHTASYWWVVEGKLAGMPMPWLDPRRRDNCGGNLDAYNDELRPLWDAGIRSVLCLLNIPGDKQVYQSAGFRFMLMPIANGAAPQSDEEVERIREFYRTSPPALAVHCEAGLGRTGTVLAMLLISGGLSMREAIERVRSAQPMAIETASQLRFLEKWEEAFQK